MAFVSGIGTVSLFAPTSSTRSCLRASPTGRFARFQSHTTLTHGRRARRQAPFAPRMGDRAPPIDAPSGVLLLSSSVLAIASVGCVFELTGGHPQYGVTFTGAVLAVSLPGFVFLFYSAIRKGQQEALDDP